MIVRLESRLLYGNHENQTLGHGHDGCGMTLFAVQALVWRSGSRGRSETDVENRTGHHRITEAPVIVGAVLLLSAGVILVVPREANRSDAPKANV
jgi:hypothetical protein